MARDLHWIGDTWYEAGPAASGRSRCKEFRCRQTIASGELRIGLKQEDHDHYGSDLGWYHPACLFRTFSYRKGANPAIRSHADVRNWGDLSAPAKDAISQLIRDGPPPLSAPSGAASESSDFPGSAGERAEGLSPNAKRPRHHDSNSESSTGLVGDGADMPEPAASEGKAAAASGDGASIGPGPGRMSTLENDAAHREEAFRVEMRNVFPDVMKMTASNIQKECRAKKVKAAGWKALVGGRLASASLTTAVDHRSGMAARCPRCCRGVMQTHCRDFKNQDMVHWSCWQGAKGCLFSVTRDELGL